jgi:hypothetical protein
MQSLSMLGSFNTDSHKGSAFTGHEVTRTWAGRYQGVLGAAALRIFLQSQ